MTTTFENLRTLIPLSNQRLIREVLLPQVRKLEDEGEKRQLMILALQRENELDAE